MIYCPFAVGFQNLKQYVVRGLRAYVDSWLSCAREDTYEGKNSVDANSQKHA